MRTNQHSKNEIYHLSSEQEAHRAVLELLSHPGRFALLALLLRGENALTTREMVQEFALTENTLYHSILHPLVKAHVLARSRGGVAGRDSEYYISPDAP